MVVYSGLSQPGIIDATARRLRNTDLEHWLCGTFGALRLQLTRIKRFITKQFRPS